MNTLSILIIDDNEAQRQYLSLLCQKLSEHEVVEVDGGERALAYLRARTTPINIAFVDLEMPTMDGVQLLRVLAQEQLVECVVVISAREPELISSVGIMAEADGLVVLGTIKKPLVPSNFKKLLMRYRPRVATTRNQIKKEFTENEIKAGLDNGEFILHYQPKLSTRELELVGMEALIRWQHPTLGVLLPEVFIPVAEQTELINEMTRHIIRQAFMQSASWKQAGLPFVININLAWSLLKDFSFITWLSSLLSEFGLSAADFSFDLSESSEDVDLAGSLAAMAHLRLIGFELSMDHYGSSFAAQKNLTKFPVAELKIDRAFVDGVADKQQLSKIVQNILDLARRLNLITVAVGVEVLEDFNWLRDMGCERLQGYLIAKPMSADSVSQWIAYELPKLGAILK